MSYQKLLLTALQHWHENYAGTISITEHTHITDNKKETFYKEAYPFVTEFQKITHMGANDTVTI